MRYRSTGNVHKDFHLATNTTIAYVLDTYGIEFLEELFARTAQRVYRSIHEALVSGDPEPLIEHFYYYYEREGGLFRVDDMRTEGGGIDFVVLECPAVRHIVERTGKVDDRFYLQFELLAKGFSEGTPFAITCLRSDDGGYTYRIRTRTDGSI
jgi:hypothetical protein